MSRQLPDEFVQEIFDELEKLKTDYAAARMNSRASEEERKIVKSQLKRAFQGPYTHSEDYAHTHPNYRKAVNDMVKAGEEMDNAEWALKIKILYFEAWRTLSANERTARS